MKQFDLQEYLKNPGQKIVTRDGRAARILCTDRNYDNYPVVALVQVQLRGGQLRDDPYCYTKDGLYLDHSENSKDLFFAPEKKVGWINIYRSTTLETVCSPGCVFNTEEEALCHQTTRVMKYLGTCKIEWEE
jgi:hypothetical protein